MKLYCSTRNVQTLAVAISTGRHTRNAGINLEIRVQAEFPSKLSLEVGVSKHWASFSSVCYHEEAVSECFALMMHRFTVFPFIKMPVSAGTADELT